MKEKHEDNKDDDDHKFQNAPGKWTMNKWTKRWTSLVAYHRSDGYEEKMAGFVTF